VTTKVRVLVAAAAVSVFIGGHLSRLGTTGIVTVSASPSLSDLKNVEELKTAFNRDAGKVRLVLLASPT